PVRAIQYERPVGRFDEPCRLPVRAVKRDGAAGIRNDVAFVDERNRRGKTEVGVETDIAVLTADGDVGTERQHTSGVHRLQAVAYVAAENHHAIAGQRLRTASEKDVAK